MKDSDKHAISAFYAMLCGQFDSSGDIAYRQNKTERKKERKKEKKEKGKRKRVKRTGLRIWPFTTNNEETHQKSNKIAKIVGNERK